MVVIAEGRGEPLCLLAVALVYFGFLFFKFIEAFWLGRRLCNPLAGCFGKREVIEPVTLLSSIDFAAQV